MMMMTIITVIVIVVIIIKIMITMKVIFEAVIANASAGAAPRAHRVHPGP